MEKRLGDWFDRLHEVIEDERDRGRDMKTLTKLVGNVGENYVQQLVKDRKASSIDKFVRLLAVLGPAKAIYVILGDPQSSEVFRLLSALPPDMRDHFLQILRSIRDDADS